MKYFLKNPGLMVVNGVNGETYAGGSQEWYLDAWHKRAGCGPVAASAVIWYMARPGFPPGAVSERDLFLALMDEMITYVKPTVRGVNTPAIFTDGMARYVLTHNLNLTSRVLEIPELTKKRPPPGQLAAFVIKAVQSDAPVAFLNLSNGSLKNLDNWHWVTIVAFDDVAMVADVCDQGQTFGVDLGEWLATTALGGAFVYLTPGDAPADI